jgi:serine protease
MSRRIVRRAAGARLRPARALLNVEQLEERSLLDGSGLSAGMPGIETGRLLVAYRGETEPVVQMVELDKGVSVEEALSKYQADPNVLFAEPDYQVQAADLPTDYNPSTLYGLARINVPGAWNVTTGSVRTVVGVIDTGIDYTHPDLYLNVWINQGEIPTAVRSALVDTDADRIITFRDLNNTLNTGKVADSNHNGYIDGKDILNAWSDGTDQDGNGYRDDVIGWDFVNNDNDPFDDNSHGTHVSGTIGATANDGGVVGINQNVEIAALKFLNASGSGSTSGAIAALNYAVAMGIRVTNNSWGGGGYSTALYNAISNARDHGDVFVAAAGNNGSNNDSTPSYPASYNLDNIISVAATDSNDNLAYFSSYGATSVDLAAPGVNILSTVPGGRYAYYSGTSMATPHVTGVVALLLSQNPTQSYSQIINRILSNVDPVAGLTGRVATGGRLNAASAVNAGNPTPQPGDTTPPTIVGAATDGGGANPATVIRVTFSEAINPATFPVSDVMFTGPNGKIAIKNVLAVAGSSNTQFDITFDTQSTPGTYTITIGPGIADLAGNTIKTTYTGSFTIVASSSTTYTNSARTKLADATTFWWWTFYGNTQSYIDVGDNTTISDLNVQLNISHTWDADLYIYLVSPNGTAVLLSNQRGGSGDNFSNTILDDEAPTAIGSASAPFAGTYRPDGSLAAFDGQSAKGRWTLVVQDRGVYDTGYLNSWSIIITGSPGSAARSVDAGPGMPSRDPGASALGSDTLADNGPSTPPPTLDGPTSSLPGSLATAQAIRLGTPSGRFLADLPSASETRTEHGSFGIRHAEAGSTGDSVRSPFAGYARSRAATSDGFSPVSLMALFEIDPLEVTAL